MKERCYLLSRTYPFKKCIALTDSHYYSSVFGVDLAKRLRGETELNCRFKLATRLNTLTETKSLDELNIEETPLEDNLDTNLFGFFMSERMRAIIDAHLSGREGLQWVKAYIDGPNGMSWIYYVPLFWKQLDILNWEKTDFPDNLVFDSDKIKDLAIFNEPTDANCLTTGVYVTHKLKTALLKAGMTGLDFFKMPVE